MNSLESYLPGGELEKPKRKSTPFRINAARLLTAGAILASCGGDGDGETEDDGSIYKGVDVMNQAKDRLSNPRSIVEKEHLIEYAKELGVTHVAIATPYDYSIGDSNQLVADPNINKETREWVDVVREAGLTVSHRHMFKNFEGIYDEKKIAYRELDYAELMRRWMVENKDLIQDGDTWTPVPEPQNGGIGGVNCNENCVFENPQEFNQFLRDIVRVSRETLDELDKDVEVICCGFDGFIVAGLANSDHEGKNSVLVEKTVTELGHIAIDHYPQPKDGVGSPQPKDGVGEPPVYRYDLDIITEMWPDVPIYITEFGTVSLESQEAIGETFKTFEEYAKEGVIKGVWWWQLGPSGPESLLTGPPDPLEILSNDNTSKSENFNPVKEGFEILP